MKKKIIIWAVIIAIIGGVVFLRISASNKGKYQAVKAAEVTQGDIKSYLSTTAIIKSKNSKDYYGLQGKVKSVNVKVGDSVKKGQVLVAYEVQDLGSQVKQAQIQYDNAKLSKQILVNNNNDITSKIADFDKQIADLDSQISAAQKSTNPAEQSQLLNLTNKREQLKSTRDNLKPASSEQLKQADNQIQLAKIGLDTAQTALSKNQDSIVADMDGVVTAVNVVEGATSMASAQPAVSVMDLSNLKAEVSVGKFDANKIQLGQEAVIKSGDKEFKGKVSFIDPAAKKTVSATGGDSTLGVEIDIVDNPQGLKVDFDADVDILLGQVNNVVKVPAECIKTTKDNKSYVYSIEGNKAVEKQVKTGIQSDMEIEIVDGVKKGDKVISNPANNIANGTLVKDSAGSGK
ncbi:efflux RND transporter periplasmic adaptor subunit [Clostridium omnivorum]|uniref:Macrolide ABC transporter n=1 Tax=Clostridium omnivorum TaxID=1604902 RepID=A0ABQ5N714_9CLOT|nr:efflux RND transporter periplasmic adaptor subunit [Clostridium sp. E14]GLC31001.1 macrolide ABC transporter [Clostridium sp. E14]